jgi:uncharacterized YigZ family protein
MNDTDYFYTVEQTASAEFKDRGSKFSAYVFPCRSSEDFKARMAELKKEHPKASHFCFAYRLGLDGNNFRVSDDGEPSGSAGKPILGRIDAKQLTDILVVTVRYFGGTLLGVPGLINAYKTTAAMALQLVPIVQKSIEIMYELQFDYTCMNDVMMILKQYNCSIAKQENQLFCLLKTGIPKAQANDVLRKLKDLHTVSVAQMNNK